MALISRRWFVVCAAMVGVCLAACSAAEAQQGRRGGFGGFGGFGGGADVPGSDWMGLLQNEKVQNEIDLLDDQKADVRKLGEEARERSREQFQGLGNFREASEEEREKMMKEMAAKREASTKETVKKIEEILLPPQVARLKQISLQVRGVNALTDPQVVKELGITTDQQAQIAKINEERGQKIRELFQGGNREANAEKMTELRKESEEKTLAVLTAEQSEKLEKMKGKKLEIDPSELRRGFGGDRGGRGQGGPRRGGNNN